MIDVSGISDKHVDDIYRQFYEYSNSGSPQTYGVQWSGELWALLFLILVSGTIGVLVRQYRTHDTTLYPINEFGPLRERATGLGFAFIVILIGQVAWAIYITVVHIINGQHY
jgi:hypothetical protein